MKKVILCLLLFVFLNQMADVSYNYAISNEDDITITVDISKESKVTSRDDTDEIIDAFNKIFLRYKTFIIGVFGLATLTTILAFIYQLTKLGAAKTPIDRKNACSSLFFCALAAGILGSLTVYFGLFYHVFA